MELWGGRKEGCWLWGLMGGRGREQPRGCPSGLHLWLCSSRSCNPCPSRDGPVPSDMLSAATSRRWEQDGPRSARSLSAEVRMNVGGQLAPTQVDWSPMGSTWAVELRGP